MRNNTTGGWENSQASDLGLAIAAQMKEDATRQSRESSSPGRTPSQERKDRRKNRRTPSQDAEGTPVPADGEAGLESVQEEAAQAKDPAADEQVEEAAEGSEEAAEKEAPEEDDAGEL